MPIYETSVVVRAAGERLWSVLSDISRWSEWTPTITRIEALGPASLEIGARYRVWQPKLIPAIWTVTALEPQRGFVWESRVLGTRVRAEHSIFSEKSESFRVVLQVGYSGAIGSAIGLVYGRLTRQYLALEADSLRRRAESDEE